MKWVSFFYMALCSVPLSRIRVLSHCPSKHCTCSSSKWFCNIGDGQEQIDCGSSINRSQQISVDLQLVNLNTSWNSFVFSNCPIKTLKISSTIIPWNSLIGNLQDLELLIIQDKPVDHSNYLNNNLYNLLSGLDKLRKVKLENILVQNWFEEFLLSCHSVQEIELKDLKIKDIQINSFVNCKNLITLTIRFNSIPNVFTDVFQGLFNLDSLILSSNKIMKLNQNDNGWWVVRNLKHLDLSDNFLSRLEPKQFIGLTKLEMLNLESNNIGFIDKTAFENLNSLQILNLQGNKKLIWFDLFTIHPMVASLITLTMDANIIQCIDGKSKLSQFHTNVQDVLNIPRDCDGRSQTMLSYSVLSSTSTPMVRNIISANFPLTISLSVIITIFILGVLFFIFYYCITRKKLRSYKNSTTGGFTPRSGSSKLYFHDTYLSPLNNTIESRSANATPNSGTNRLIPRYNSYPVLMS